MHAISGELKNPTPSSWSSLIAFKPSGAKRLTVKHKTVKLKIFNHFQPYK
jgi:hypothetical protein